MFGQIRLTFNIRELYAINFPTPATEVLLNNRIRDTLEIRVTARRHATQHNDTQPNATQPNATQPNDTQLNDIQPNDTQHKK